MFSCSLLAGQNLSDTSNSQSGSGSDATTQTTPHLITLEEYCSFLNAVAMIDTHSLYDEKVGLDEIIRSGGPGSYVYSVVAGKENSLIVDISWNNAARYCNWCENGMPSWEENPAATESGIYEFQNDQVSSITETTSNFFVNAENISNSQNENNDPDLRSNEIEFCEGMLSKKLSDNGSDYFSLGDSLEIVAIVAATIVGERAGLCGRNAGADVEEDDQNGEHIDLRGVGLTITESRLQNGEEQLNESSVTDDHHLTGLTTSSSESRILQLTSLEAGAYNGNTDITIDNGISPVSTPNETQSSGKSVRFVDDVAQHAQAIYKERATWMLGVVDQRAQEFNHATIALDWLKKEGASDNDLFCMESWMEIAKQHHNDATAALSRYASPKEIAGDRKAVDFIQYQWDNLKEAPWVLVKDKYPETKQLASECAHIAQLRSDADWLTSLRNSGFLGNEINYVSRYQHREPNSSIIKKLLPLVYGTYAISEGSGSFEEQFDGDNSYGRRSKRAIAAQENVKKQAERAEGQASKFLPKTLEQARAERRESLLDSYRRNGSSFQGLWNDEASATEGSDNSAKKINFYLWLEKLVPWAQAQADLLAAEVNKVQTTSKLVRRKVNFAPQTVMDRLEQEQEMYHLKGIENFTPIIEECSNGAAAAAAWVQLHYKLQSLALGERSAEMKDEAMKQAIFDWSEKWNNDLHSRLIADKEYRQSSSSSSSSSYSDQYFWKLIPIGEEWLEKRLAVSTAYQDPSYEKIRGIINSYKFSPSDLKELESAERVEKELELIKKEEPEHTARLKTELEDLFLKSTEIQNRLADIDLELESLESSYAKYRATVANQSLGGKIWDWVIGAEQADLEAKDEAKEKILEKRSQLWDLKFSNEFEMRQIVAKLSEKEDEVKRLQQFIHHYWNPSSPVNY